MHTQTRLPESPGPLEGARTRDGPESAPKFRKQPRHGVYATRRTATRRRLRPPPGLMELLCDVHGIGELRLLASALTRLKPRRSALDHLDQSAFRALRAGARPAGIDIGKVLLVLPEKPSRGAVGARAGAEKRRVERRPRLARRVGAQDHRDPPTAARGSDGPHLDNAVPSRRGRRQAVDGGASSPGRERTGGEMRPPGIHHPEAPGRLAHFAHRAGFRPRAHSPRARGRRRTTRVLAPPKRECGRLSHGLLTRCLREKHGTGRRQTAAQTAQTT